jgi:hypothetical protein
MLSGCTVSSERPDLALEIPPKYGAGQGVSALTNLIEEAQVANLDIGAAIGRIMQADAQAKIAGAPLLPAVNFTGFAERFRNPGGPDRNLFQGALNASYEIDFWGKNRANSRAAEENAVASRFNKEVVVLSTIASVGNAYFQVLSSQDRLRIARQNLDAANRVLSLIKQRFEAGTASQLDVAQQESLVRRCARPSAVRPDAAAEHCRARGADRQTAGAGRDQGRQPLSAHDPEVTLGLPSELLFQRPDIRAAEADLASADASVEAARAAFFPRGAAAVADCDLRDHVVLRVFARQPFAHGADDRDRLRRRRRHRHDREHRPPYGGRRGSVRGGVARRERKQGLSPRESIVQASLLRFRPIMMTTQAALFGAIPLAFESGTGSELRNPLGITVIGGLLLSQLLTLYTTPVVYLAVERLKTRFTRPAPLEAELELPDRPKPSQRPAE